MFFLKVVNKFFEVINLRNEIIDIVLVHIKFKLIFGKKLNIKNPQTFEEKIQYLKLFDRNPRYTHLVDKVAVKECIKSMIGSNYIVPTLGVYKDFDDINFDLLPEQFVIKCSHDSGSTFVCKDKRHIDINRIRSLINKSLSMNYYCISQEWPYKNIEPRIIIEQYICDDNTVSVEKQELSDYKFYCFDGFVDCVMVCYDRESKDTKYYFFDKEWNLKKYNLRGTEAPLGFSLPKPKNFDEMLKIASILSKNISFVRVDLYQSNNKVYFSEMTFYPQSGFDKNYTVEAEKHFGNLINLNLSYTRRKKYEKR